ncbi:MAG: sigma-70 family RNA polymerase sigma factor [Planctomycetota bacterium]|nr:sigma-70 family RNA polymerase sigma factor [Planctomycetota bacterium]
MPTPSPSPTIGVENLLEYEPFVRAVARGVLADEGQVEDVVQETWIRAMRRPPKVGGSVKAWLARVVKNLARDTIRGESRRSDREVRAARPELDTALPVDELQGRLEAHRQVVEAVLALPEPYKDVVVLAYYQGLKPAEIAARLDRKPATVRTQLHRAHELLRQRLDAAFEGDRSAWAILVVPFLPEPSPVGQGAPGAASGLAGGGLSTWAMLLVALLAGLPLLWLLPDDQPAGGGPGEAEALVGLDQPGPEATGIDPTGLRTPVLGEPDRTAATPRRLTVEVRFGDALLEGATAWLLADQRPDPRSAGRFPGSFGAPEIFRSQGTSAEVGSDGLAHFELGTAREALVLVEAPDPHDPERLLLAVGDLLDAERAATGPRLSLRPTPAKRVQVRVQADGAPAPGAQVCLRAGLARGRTSTVLSAETGPDGRLELVGFDLLPLPQVGPAPTTWAVALAVPGATSRELYFEPEVTSTPGAQPLGLRLAPTGSLDVQLVDAGGAPLAHDGEARLTVDGAQVFVPLVAGRAHFAHVGLGKQLQLVAQLPDLGATWAAEARGPAGRDQAVLVEVRRPDFPRLTGRALAPDGRPLADAELFLSLQSRAGKEQQRKWLRTSADGRFEVQLNDERGGILASDRQHRVLLLQRGLRGWSGVGTGELVEINDALTDLGELVVQPRAGWIRGRCVDADGQPLEGLLVSAPQEFEGLASHFTTAADGRFELLGLWPLRASLTISSADRPRIESLLAAPGETDQVIVVPEGAVLRGSLLVDAGVDASDFVLRARALDGGGEVNATAREGGLLRLGRLSAGDHQLSLLHHGKEARDLGVVRLRAGEEFAPPHLDGIDLRGSFEAVGVRLEDADGLPIPAPRAQVLVDGRVVSSTRGSAGLVSVSVPRQSESTSTVVVLDAASHRPVRLSLERLAAAEVVVLEPAICLELRLAPGSVSRPSWSFALEPVEPGTGLFEGRVPLPESFQEAGHAELCFPAPGLYRLVRRGARPDTPKHLTGWEPDPSGTVLAVTEADHGGELELDLP